VTVDAHSAGKFPKRVRIDSFDECVRREIQMSLGRLHAGNDRIEGPCEISHGLILTLRPMGSISAALPIHPDPKSGTWHEILDQQHRRNSRSVPMIIVSTLLRYLH
jgi:hypothetical protein